MKFVTRQIEMPADEYYSTAELLQEEILSESHAKYTSIIDKYTCLAHGLTPSPGHTDTSRDDHKKSLRSLLAKHKPSKRTSLQPSINGSVCAVVTPKAAAGARHDDNFEEEVEQVLQKRKAELGLPSDCELKPVDSPCVPVENCSVDKSDRTLDHNGNENQFHYRTRATTSKNSITVPGIKNRIYTGDMEIERTPVTSHRKGGGMRRGKIFVRDSVVPDVCNGVESNERDKDWENRVVKKHCRLKHSNIIKKSLWCKGVLAKKRIKNRAPSRNRGKSMKTTPKGVENHDELRNHTSCIIYDKKCVKSRGKQREDPHSQKENADSRVNPRLQLIEMSPTSAAREYAECLFSVGNHNQPRIVLTKTLNTMILPAPFLQRAQPQSDAQPRQSSQPTTTKPMEKSDVGYKTKPCSRGQQARKRKSTGDGTTASGLIRTDPHREEEEAGSKNDSGEVGEGGETIGKLAVCSESVLSGSESDESVEHFKSFLSLDEADHCLEEETEGQKSTQVSVHEETNKKKSSTKEIWKKKEPSESIATGKRSPRQATVQEKKQPHYSAEKDKKRRLQTEHTSQYDSQLSPERETELDLTREEEEARKSPVTPRLRPVVNLSLSRERGRLVFDMQQESSRKKEVLEDTSGGEEVQSVLPNKTIDSDDHTFDKIDDKESDRETEAPQECQAILQQDVSLQTSPEKATAPDSTQDQAAGSMTRERYRPVIDLSLTRQRGKLVFKMANVNANKKAMLSLQMSDTEDDLPRADDSKKNEGNNTPTGRKTSSNSLLREKQVHQKNSPETEMENKSPNASTVSRNHMNAGKTHQGDQSPLQKCTKQPATQDRWDKRQGESVLAGIDVPNKRRRTIGRLKRNSTPEDQCHVVSSSVEEDNVLILPAPTRKTLFDERDSKVHDEPNAKKKKEDSIPPLGVSRQSHVTVSESMGENLWEERVTKNTTSNGRFSPVDRTAHSEKPVRKNQATTEVEPEEEEEEFHRLASGGVSLLTGSHHSSLKSIIKTCFGSQVSHSQVGSQGIE